MSSRESEVVLYPNRSSRRGFLLRLGIIAASCGFALAAPLLAAKAPLKKITYAVATADLNIGYPTPRSQGSRLFRAGRA